MQLKESRLASADLDAIFEYGKLHHGLGAAVTYLAEIERCYRQLLVYPASNRRDCELGPGVHSMSCHSHRIYYEYDDETILVLRIIHKSADVTRWLD